MKSVLFGNLVVSVIVFFFAALYGTSFAIMLAFVVATLPHAAYKLGGEMVDCYLSRTGVQEMLYQGLSMAFALMAYSFAIENHVVAAFVAATLSLTNAFLLGQTMRAQTARDSEGKPFTLLQLGASAIPFIGLVLGPTVFLYQMEVQETDLL